MYKFFFAYVDGSYQDFNHINKVEYHHDGKNQVVMNDDILSHKFPLYCDKHLFAAKSTHLVSASNIKFVSIEKED